MAIETQEVVAEFLTVILRDDSPMIHSNDSPTFRTVHIPLTCEQSKMMARRLTHTNGGTKFYESISRAYVEELL
jgi:hypothetical protein